MNNSHSFQRQYWGTHQGQDVWLHRLTSKSGASVELTNYGATLVSVNVPDRRGLFGNVILGYPSLTGYLSDTAYIGSTIGRFANRIGGASFRLGDACFHLDQNDGANTNHGGFHGFHSQVFETSETNNGIVFSLSSPDGEGGFPGNLQMSVEYSWSDSHQLTIRYRASADQQTIANFTNHAYFNLSGFPSDIFDHHLTIAASTVLETGAAYIPTGQILPVGDLSFQGHRVGHRVSMVDGEVRGLNTYYVFEEPADAAKALRCKLTHSMSGRVLEVFTTYPGVQLYTGDFLNSVNPGHHSVPHGPYNGLCLECQLYPDSPNHPHFPSATLNADQEYDHTIIYQFSLDQ